MDNILKWTPIKYNLSKKLKGVAHANPGEIWWVKIGQNLGTEIYGKGDTFSRPVFLLKKNHQQSFIGIPLTSNTRPAHYKQQIFIKEKENALLFNQARCIDTVRLDKRIARVSEKQYQNILNNFCSYININPPSRA